MFCRPRDLFVLFCLFLGFALPFIVSQEPPYLSIRNLFAGLGIASTLSLWAVFVHRCWPKNY